ncbi:unnamed protein product [Spodoptera littoralis]|uniref:Uncharacterized protein n=1 Tax=Spodoptera littoralis TaxID=7109 RepID=A0A9P0IHD6_SPOLI|nr:unnamed protein product [Spodoptera littoralis]CAH1647612.1 unnamed protein product [Spodoptera littoralis]
MLQYDHLVVNEVLTFIQFELENTPEIFVKMKCLENYDEHELSEARTLLYRMLNVEPGFTSYYNKESNLQDIFDLLRKTPKHEQPVFVARNWRKMPHAYDNILIYTLLGRIEQLQGLLRYVLSLRKAERDAANARKRQYEQNKRFGHHRFQFPIRQIDQATAPHPVSVTISTSATFSGTSTSVNTLSIVYTETSALPCSTSFQSLLYSSADSSSTPKMPNSSIIGQPSEKSAFCKVIGSSRRPKTSILPSTTVVTSIAATTRKTTMPKDSVITNLVSSLKPAAMTSVIPMMTSELARPVTISTASPSKQATTSVFPILKSSGSVLSQVEPDLARWYEGVPKIETSPVWLANKLSPTNAVPQIGANCALSTSYQIATTSRVQTTFKAPITSEIPMKPSSERPMHLINSEYREQIARSQFRPIETPMQRHFKNPR